MGKKDRRWESIVCSTAVDTKNEVLQQKAVTTKNEQEEEKPKKTMTAHHFFG